MAGHVKCNTMAYFGLLLDSMKGLEFIPTPPAPLPPTLPKLTPLYTHLNTHARTNVTPPPPCHHRHYQHLFFIHKVEVPDQVFKHFVFLV